MTKTKLQSLVEEKISYPINGFTQQPYKNSNHHNLNESYKKNGFTHNIWMSENQCMKMGITVIDKNNPSHTIGRYGDESKVFNISQTNYIKSTVKKVVVKKSTTQSTQLQRIEKLEEMVVKLYEMVNG